MYMAPYICYVTYRIHVYVDARHIYYVRCMYVMLYVQIFVNVQRLHKTASDRDRCLSKMMTDKIHTKVCM